MPSNTTPSLRRIGRLGWIAAAALLALPVFSHAQGTDYPRQPIKLVVPYPPGGGADSLARLVAGKLGEKIGQTVVVDNRPGANTMLATELASRQPADGYTLLYIASSFTINPSLYKPNYSTEKDFVPVAFVARVPLILVSNNNYPARKVSDVIAAAKAQPGKVTFASYGLGSPAHLAGELFEQLTDTTMLHVPYKGSAPALTDLLGGQVNLAFSSIEPALQIVRTQKIHPIAVTTAKRLHALPDVPTIAEMGVKGFEASGWNGIVAPAGTPQPIVSRLNQAINEALQSPDLQQKFEKQGVEIELMAPQAFGTMIRAEMDKWAAVIKKANVKLN
ncbi:tripartite-type tricarboxylate transporter receptor subunit TctC [Cupriavidus gilardii J11]|uniref:Tripartite-type tricarboxylate transporter receptor subunit TctC n=1 Tax=Cupriavidus gilardii J11 TaxID=936133 RepID=A0A562BMD2_9BURK|nr:tripartite tricarboxylate transporter substrate binding protein [Cupriavidus gilardii]TWG86231.1 tripartite-type tricarboxylate transporter receptor subunit TctC [Cupriavidus gilardii J11]